VESELPGWIWASAIALSIIVGVAAAIRLGAKRPDDPGGSSAWARLGLALAGGAGIAIAVMAGLGLLLYSFESVAL